MHVTLHPTWTVGYESASIGHEEVVHAKLWIVVEVSAWDTRRQGHLHVVRPTASLDGDWRIIELSRHPLRVDAAGELSPVDITGSVEALRRWLSGWRLELFRQPDILMVSEVGESEAGFRRRMVTCLGPEVRRRLARLDAPRSAQPPQRTRPLVEAQAPAQQHLVTAVAELAGRLERHRVPDPLAVVRRAEVGVLRLPPGVDVGSTG